MTAVYVGVGIYFACMIMVGYVVKSKVKTAEGYLVAGRAFGLLQNSMALTACFLGGSLVLSVPGLTLKYGVWSDDAMWGATAVIGGIFLLVIIGFFYMPQLWRLKLLSLGDYFYLRFGKTTGLLVSLVMAGTFVFYIGVQILVFAKVCTAFMGWPLVTAAIIGIGIVTIYTVLGGLWAIMATDMIQVFLVAIGIIVLTPIAISLVGGWEGFTSQMDASKLQMLPQVPESSAWLAWLASLSLVGIGGIVSPDIMQRAFAAKTPGVAKNSAWVAFVVKTGLTVLMVILALVGGILISNGTISLTGDLNGDHELIVPVMVKNLLPTPLMIIFLGACLSAVMGAASSALLAMAAMISKNLWKDFLKPETTDKELVLVSRICVVVFALIALYLALRMKFVYMLMAFGFDLIMSSLLACMTLGMYWKKANKYGAMASIISGLLVRVIGAGLENGFTLEGVASSSPSWYVYTLAAPVVSFIVMWSVSLATQKVNPSNEFGFHFDENGDVIRPEKENSPVIPETSAA